MPILSREELNKLSQIISLTEVAALCAGYPSSNVHWDVRCGRYVLNTYDDAIGEEHPYGNEVFDTVLTSITRAIIHNQLKATVVVDKKNYLGYIQNQASFPDTEESSRDNLISKLDPSKTTVYMDDLKEWFLKQGVKPEALFPKTDSLSLFDINHHCYAPKLAALVAAWLYLVENGVPIGKTAKQALKDHLKEHAGLKDKDGKPLSDENLEKLASTANWDDLGKISKYLGDIIGVDREIFEARQPLTYELHKKRSINQALIPDSETFSRIYQKYDDPPKPLLEDDLPF